MEVLAKCRRPFPLNQLHPVDSRRANLLTHMSKHIKTINPPSRGTHQAGCLWPDLLSVWRQSHLLHPAGADDFLFCRFLCVFKSQSVEQNGADISLVRSAVDF